MMTSAGNFDKRFYPGVQPTGVNGNKMSSNRRVSTAGDPPDRKGVRAPIRSRIAPCDDGTP